MDKYILAVHFQAMKDDGKLANLLFNSDMPIVAMLVPNLLDPTMKTAEGEKIYRRIHSEENYYPDWAKKIFRNNKDNPNVIWGQEGYRHCCGRCFNKGLTIGKKSPDPYHEHVCLDGHSQNLDEQTQVIMKGKKLIFEELGITPEVYCPPNHLYNEDTILAADKNNIYTFLTRNGFDYFIPNLIKMPFYVDDQTSLMIFPETKGGKSPVRMSYYDKDQNGLLSSLVNSRSWDNFCGSHVSSFKVGLNIKLIKEHKKLRDIKNSLF